MSAAAWTACNVAAWCGWAYVLARVVVDATPWAAPGVAGVVASCEFYCCVEVARMVVGSLRGNVPMGLVLHATRLVVLHGVLPGAGRDGVVRAILVAWAATEVARYPMYVCRGVACFETLRSVAPVVTFPLGVIFEGRGLYLRMSDADVSLPLQVLAAVALASNLVLGPYGYASVLARGHRALFSREKKKA